MALLTTAARLIGLLVRSRVLIKAAQAAISYRKEHKYAPDEQKREPVAGLEARLARTDKELLEIKRRLRRITTAAYGLAALVLAALALALISTP